MVLDPQFLSKVTMAGFFRLEEEAKEKRKDGVIHHSDLKLFWAEREQSSVSFSSPASSLVDRDDFWEIAELLMSFMEKFDVCFGFGEDQGKPFKERRSLLPSLLPERKNDRVIRSELASLNEPMAEIRTKIKGLSSKIDIIKEVFDTKDFTSSGISKLEALENELKNEKKKLEELVDREMELGYELNVAQPWKKYWGDELGIGQTVQFERVFQFGNIPAELISRMLARLHGMIEGDCVKRDFALLKNDDGTQVKLTVDLPIDQFVIEIRSRSLELGEKMLSEIKDSISKVLDLYPQLTVADPPSSPLADMNETAVVVQHQSQIIEGVRSPFSGRIIPMDKIKEANGLDLKIGDELGISLRKLKEMAGLIAPRPLVKKQSMSLLSLSVCLLFSTKPMNSSLLPSFFNQLVLKEGPTSSRWTELVKMIELLGGQGSQIKVAFDIEDPEYLSMFEGNRKQLFQQQQNAPAKFQSHDYLELKGSERRQKYLGLLEKRYQPSLELLGEGENIKGGKKAEECKTKVIIQAHGTSESTGWMIAQGGFGIAPSLDAGWYGEGIYFTSRLEYAIDYCNRFVKSVLVISIVNPGNAFPVIERPDDPKEGLKGSKCRGGYQSHYCVTGKGVYPVSEGNLMDDSRDEVVVFDRAQALPKFIVYFN